MLAKKHIAVDTRVNDHFYLSGAPETGWPKELWSGLTICGFMFFVAMTVHSFYKGYILAFLSIPPM